MSSLERLLRRMRGLDGVRLGRGLPETRILEAEHALGHAIRGQYRLFLREVGWAALPHDDVYGLGRDDFPDVVRVTKSERTEMEPRIPPHLLPVMNDGFGNLYCLDVRHPEPPVVFWDHHRGRDQQPERIADDLASWLLERIEGATDPRR